MFWLLRCGLRGATKPDSQPVRQMRGRFLRSRMRENLYLLEYCVDIQYILSTSINCVFFIGGTKLIQPTNNDPAPCSHYDFGDLKKLKLWRCEV
jgi:hypothetical protein